MELSTLTKPIEELLHASLRECNVKENDAVSLKTLKLVLVNQVLKVYGLRWGFLINLFKTHTPIHPDIARDLVQLGDEEITSTVAQIFVRNEKLVRLVKGLAQQGLGIEALLAVDGLSGSHVPNFEHKQYVGHLRFGELGQPPSEFDNEPEYKRRHVQTVRQLYKKLEQVSSPEKHIYQIVRHCLQETAGTKLPDLQWEEKLDRQLENECRQYYMDTMGKEHIENLAKTIKRNRGEKRTLEREDETVGKNEK